MPDVTTDVVVKRANSERKGNAENAFMDRSKENEWNSFCRRIRAQLVE
jgi:hypothetical protein